ncbi:hypothetical protein [Gemmatimonas sp.]|jgi:hypothetical protein|uniref:hypothetical protein n=1 Tax=Gemmatimonas sp. TaxID=1962908 RepID=UPI0022BDB45D|nr:hypothetical protein [Gemmatimonas sp.]MCZ8204661.1 hypothetical protein [Gemmatimonas sp.]
MAAGFQYRGAFSHLRTFRVVIRPTSACRGLMSTLLSSGTTTEGTSASEEVRRPLAQAPEQRRLLAHPRRAANDGRLFRRTGALAGGFA